MLVELGFTARLAALDAHISHRATVDSMRRLLEHEGFEFVEAVKHGDLEGGDAGGGPAAEIVSEEVDL